MGSKPVLFRKESPRDEEYMRVYGIHGRDHLIVESTHGDTSKIDGWCIQDTRFSPGLDKWARWLVIRFDRLDEVREWVREGGPALWDPEKRKLDKAWTPLPESMELVDLPDDETSPEETGERSKALGKREVRRIALHTVAMMINAAREHGYGLPQEAIDSLHLGDDEVWRIEDEIERFRQELLDRADGKVKRGSTHSSPRGQVQGRAHPGIGAEQRVGRVSGGEVRSGRREESRGRDDQTRGQTHRQFRPSDVEGKRFAVVPGTVTSESDGQRHFVGFSSLVKLYGVDPRECVQIPETMHGEKLPDYLESLIWLTPQRHGRLYNEMREELARGADAFKLD